MSSGQFAIKGCPGPASRCRWAESGGADSVPDRGHAAATTRPDGPDCARAGCFHVVRAESFLEVALGRFGPLDPLGLPSSSALGFLLRLLLLPRFDPLRVLGLDAVSSRDAGLAPETAYASDTYLAIAPIAGSGATLFLTQAVRGLDVVDLGHRVPVD